MSEEMITITKEEYNELKKGYDIYNCLRCCGVDNWCGWDDAMQMYNGED